MKRVRRITNGQRAPSRTIRQVTDLVTMRTITSDDLLRADPDEYQEIRRGATKARLNKQARFVCEKCGYAVYAPRETRTRLPYWQHFKGAPTNCPWWRGDSSSIDLVNGKQFQGRQESELHFRLKHLVAELLMADSRTEPGSVLVDEYLVGPDGRRRPDVRATYDGRDIALEIQLATTQLPIIVKREDFYEHTGRSLLWLTWQFEPVPRSRMLTAFEDIFYSHNKNLFSLDDEVVARSKTERQFSVRAFWEAKEGWKDKIFGLPELTWPASGLPFAVAPAPPWHLDFRSRWLAATTPDGTDSAACTSLLGELAQHIGAPGLTASWLEDAELDVLLNCLLSFEQNHPIGSRQSKLIEVINTFLNAPRRHRHARLIRSFLIRTDHADLLERDSVKRKFEAAFIAPQTSQDSAIARIASTLFPDVLGTSSHR